MSPGEEAAYQPFFSCLVTLDTERRPPSSSDAFISSLSDMQKLESLSLPGVQLLAVRGRAPPSPHPVPALPGLRSLEFCCGILSLLYRRNGALVGDSHTDTASNAYRSVALFIPAAWEVESASFHGYADRFILLVSLRNLHLYWAPGYSSAIPSSLMNAGDLLQLASIRLLQLYFPDPQHAAGVSPRRCHQATRSRSSY